ncbi:aminotransferase class V-fold PLP-dependent enzyme [Ekhidna sp.]|jgi:aromatic-L-amino-acid decarboxylase|uniref:pyridoxal phosphate-dependent decarboxylase family protein n=1 Tax=Ekhidna sp. TaxID=2608089 RepID=UPI0032ECC566
MIEKIKDLEEIARQLEPDPKQKQELTKMVINHTEEFLSRLPDENAYFQNSEPENQDHLSETPTKINELLGFLRSRVEYDGINAASGGHMGYVPGGGLYPSALGDFLAAVSNKYAGIYFPAPGAARIENMLIRWMNELMGFPPNATGNLTSGGSISNLIAVVTAREAAEVKAKDFDKLVVYLSDQAHHSLQKALRIAGLGEAQLRYLPIDDEFRLNISTLEDIILKDKTSGLIPFFINASLGTTNTGTIDPIEEMAAVAQKHLVWFHVDAAYGGFFRMLPDICEKTKGIEKADSITLDPHKSLFLPFGTGAVLIKDLKSLYKAHRYTADYLQDLVDSDSEVNAADVSPELTKHFRGLRMWLPLKLFGLKPFRAALKEKMLLAQYFREQIKKEEGFEVAPVPDLSITMFRYVPAHGDAYAFNERLIKAIQDDGRIFLSSTTIHGKFWIRVAIVVFRTHKDKIDLLLRIVKEKKDKLNA